MIASAARPTNPMSRNGTWMIQSVAVSRENVGQAATSTTTSTPTRGAPKRLPLRINNAPSAKRTAKTTPTKPTAIESRASPIANNTATIRSVLRALKT